MREDPKTLETVEPAELEEEVFDSISGGIYPEFDPDG